MKKVIIKSFDHAEVDAVREPFGFMRIPPEHSLIRAEGEKLEVSDGYHTFDELYDHRIALFRAVCRACFALNLRLPRGDNYYIPLWRSKTHHDGSSYDGWFIAGIDDKKGEQISYHIPLENWKDFDFMDTLDQAPEWDGHTPADVIERLKKL